MRDRGSKTLDWDVYWRREDDNPSMRDGALKMARRIDNFIRGRDVMSFADFGCGPAIMIFSLAESHPDIKFIGFDVSRIIIEKNRKKAKMRGLVNMSFECDSLPSLKCERKFDIVSSIATLHYVEKITDAICNLYRMVNRNGFLIFNYPNIYTARWYQNNTSENNEQMKQRFSHVINERNLISLSKIHRALGVMPKSFWHAVGEIQSRGNNCVFIRKK